MQELQPGARARYHVTGEIVTVRAVNGAKSAKAGETMLDCVKARGNVQAYRARLLRPVPAGGR